MQLNNDRRYIYKVYYKLKSGEDYKVISKVAYLRWDKEEQKFVERIWDRINFAKGLENNEYEAKAGLRYNYDDFKDLVKVISYRDNDNEIWLKTQQDETKKNNLESLIDYDEF